MERTNNKPAVCILTLDPSLTAFGWAVMCKNKVIDSGCIKTATDGKKSRIRKSDSRMQRVSFICNELTDIIEKYAVRCVLSELPHGSQSAVAAIALGLVSGAVQGICDAKRLSLEWYSEGDSKKASLGKISAGKDEMIEAMKKIYGDTWIVKAKYVNEAVADSISVYNCARKLSPMVKMLLH